jgi:peptidoglycan/LPS O-acetylase OafA/YrhL
MKLHERLHKICKFIEVAKYVIFPLLLPRTRHFIASLTARFHIIGLVLLLLLLLLGLLRLAHSCSDRI